MSGNIINISKKNLTHIEPHKLELENNIYLFFNECKEAYINTLGQSIQLENAKESNGLVIY